MLDVVPLRLSWQIRDLDCLLSHTAPLLRVLTPRTDQRRQVNSAPQLRQPSQRARVVPDGVPEWHLPRPRTQGLTASTLLALEPPAAD